MTHSANYTAPIKIGAVCYNFRMSMLKDILSLHNFRISSEARKSSEACLPARQGIAGALSRSSDEAAAEIIKLVQKGIF